MGGWLRDPQAVSVTGNGMDEVAARVAYRDFLKWCTDEGIQRMHVPRQAEFTQRVGASGIQGLVRVRTKSGRVFRGMRLVTYASQGR